MDNDIQSELSEIIARWLEANPMHTTLFGRSINLHGGESDVPGYANWMAQAVVDAVQWSDQNSESF